MNSSAPPAVDTSKIKIEDDDDSDLQLALALHRTRKLQKLGSSSTEVKVGNLVRYDVELILFKYYGMNLFQVDRIEDDDDDMGESKLAGSIVLNSTAEFCRTLGDIPTYGQAGNRDEDEQELYVGTIQSRMQYIVSVDICSNERFLFA